MAVGDAHVFSGFLTPVLTQPSIQSHRLLFSHASAEVRGKNTPERKFASTGSRTHNHQVKSPTCSPLRHSGRAILWKTLENESFSKWHIYAQRCYFRNQEQIILEYKHCHPNLQSHISFFFSVPISVQNMVFSGLGFTNQEHFLSFYYD